MTYKSRAGMRFNYSFTYAGYTAYFSYGQQSLTFTMPTDTWDKMSKQERHRWRQSKYFEAESHFGISFGPSARKSLEIDRPGLQVKEL